MCARQDKARVRVRGRKPRISSLERRRCSERRQFLPRLALLKLVQLDDDLLRLRAHLPNGGGAIDRPDAVRLIDAVLCD